MKKKYDIIIIGGGPAGTSLGYLLVKAGYDCLLIEKSVYPREKLCGGLLTEKTVELLEQIYQKPFTCYKRKEDIVKIYDKKGRLRQTVHAAIPFYLVERTEFDTYLAEEYKQAGGEILEGCRVKTVYPESSKIGLMDGTELNYKYLIGADGAASTIRKYVDRDYHPTGFCLEVSPKTVFSEEGISLYVGIINRGYGWVFPKGDVTCIGLGGELKKSHNMPEQFRKYCCKQGVPHEGKRPKGAFVPYGTYVKHPEKSNILLIGDAAGLSDPVTGEGIYFALLSAFYAAEAIMEPGKTGLKYRRKLSKIHWRIFQTELAKKIFYLDFICFCVMYLAQWNRELVAFALEHVVSRYDTSYWMLLPAYLTGTCFKKISKK